MDVIGVRVGIRQFHVARTSLLEIMSPSGETGR